MANTAGDIGHVNDDDLPAVRVIVPPDSTGRLFEDDIAPEEVVFDHRLTPMLVWHERYPIAAASGPAGCSATPPTATAMATPTTTSSA